MPEQKLQENPDLMPLLYNSLSARNVAQLAGMLRRTGKERPEGYANAVGKKQPLRWSVLNQGETRAAGYDPQRHIEFLMQFYTGEYPGSFAEGKSVDVGSGVPAVQGSVSELCGVKKALRAGNTYELELALKRELLLYKTAAAMNGSMAFTGRKQPSGLKEWQKAWLQEEFDKMKQVRRCSGLFGPDCPGSVLQTWNGGVLGFARGIHMLALANFTDQPQTVGSGCMQPFIKYGSLRDLLQGAVVQPDQPAVLGPYECFWLVPREVCSQ